MTDELKAESEAFEKWADKEHLILAHHGAGRAYWSFDTNAAWKAWQARAKLDRTQNAGGDVEVSYGRQVCPNCDTLLPGGCGGVFKDEKECQWDGEDHD